MSNVIVTNLGIVGMKPCGVYDNTRSYEKLNIVSYNGNSYCAKGDTIGHLPTDSRYWVILVEKSDLNSSDIVDNLLSNDSDKILSAKQGKILKDLTDKKPYYFQNINAMKAYDLKIGDLANTLGYYNDGDGGGAIYKIRSIAEDDIIDNMFIIPLNDPLLIAELVPNDIINILQVGAKKDDEDFDNSTIINSLSQKFNNILIPEGNFYVKNPLLINLTNCVVRGLSFKSKLIATEDINDNDYILTFSTTETSYLGRTNKGQKIGNFCVVGNNQNQNGINFGNGTDNFECLYFEQIRVENCNIGFHLNNHNYSTIYSKLDVLDVNYCLYTDDNLTDSGEILTFINCTFYYGSIYLNCSANFISCAIHLLTQNTKNGLTFGHYFQKGNITFTACHFESLVQNSQIANTVRYNTFYADNQGNLYFNDCEFVISVANNTDANHQTVGNAFFVTNNDKSYNATSSININNCNMIHFIPRLYSDPNNQAYFYKGNINLKNITYKFHTNQFTNLMLPLTNTNSDFTNGLKQYNNDLLDDIIMMTNKTINSYSVNTNEITLNMANDSNSQFFIGKLYELNNNGFVYSNIKVTTETIDTVKLVNSTKQNATYRSLYFLDENKNIIYDDPYNAEFLETTTVTHDVYSEFNYYTGVPNNAKFVLVGIGGYGLAWQTTVKFIFDHFNVKIC